MKLCCMSLQVQFIFSEVTVCLQLKQFLFVETLSSWWNKTNILIISAICTSLVSLYNLCKKSVRKSCKSIENKSPRTEPGIIPWIMLFFQTSCSIFQGTAIVFLWNDYNKLIAVAESWKTPFVSGNEVALY